MAKLHVLATILLAGATLATPALAAETITMTVDGQKQGQLKGDDTAKGQANSMIVDAFSYGTSAAFDPASGASTGRRTHQTLSVVKLLDESSIGLMQAMVTNENLPKVVLTMSSSATTGVGAAKPQTFTITLTNAHISSITQNGVSSADGGSGHSTETVAFVFEKIEEAASSVTVIDDWSLPL